MAPYRLPECFNAVLSGKTIAQFPTHYKSAVNVNYGSEMHKPFPHWDIGDIKCPDLIGPRYRQISQQVWTNILRLTQFTQIRPRIQTMNRPLS